MQWQRICLRVPDDRLVTLLDARIAGVLTAGMLSSLVLLAMSTPPPTLSVEQLWALGEETDLTAVGSLVSLRSFESGSEVMVLADLGGGQTAKVVCTYGPGPPPSTHASIGDLVSVRGRCSFEDEAPTVYCRYPDVSVLLQSEKVLTVAILGASWELFLGDTFSIEGVATLDDDLVARLADAEGGCSIQMRLGGLAPVEGNAFVVATLILDRSTMTLLLEVAHIAPA